MTYIVGCQGVTQLGGLAPGTDLVTAGSTKIYGQSLVKNHLVQTLQVIIPFIFSPFLLILPTSTLANYSLCGKQNDNRLYM